MLTGSDVETEPVSAVSDPTPVGWFERGLTNKKECRPKGSGKGQPRLVNGFDGCKDARSQVSHSVVTDA